MKKQSAKKPRVGAALIDKKNQERKSLEKKLGKSAIVNPQTVQEQIGVTRLNKLRAEVELLEARVAVMNREYISASKVREDAISIFSILKSEIGAQENNLPPLLEGLDAKAMRGVIARHSEKLLKDLSERIEAID